MYLAMKKQVTSLNNEVIIRKGSRVM